MATVAQIPAERAHAARPGTALRRRLGADWHLGYLFVLPMVVMVLALVAYPFCYAAYLSLTRKYVGVPPVFVGFENYVRLAYDGFFRRAVWNRPVGRLAPGKDAALATGMTEACPLAELEPRLRALVDSVTEDRRATS